MLFVYPIKNKCKKNWERKEGWKGGIKFCQNDVGIVEADREREAWL